jgi:hypothetical protein
MFTPIACYFCDKPAKEEVYASQLDETFYLVECPNCTTYRIASEILSAESASPHWVEIRSDLSKAAKQETAQGRTLEIRSGRDLGIASEIASRVEGRAPKSG